MLVALFVGSIILLKEQTTTTDIMYDANTEQLRVEPYGNELLEQMVVTIDVTLNLPN